MGLRKAELCALRWEALDLDQRVGQIQNQEHFTTKNGKNRAVPLSDDLCAILRQHRRPSGFVLKPGLGYAVAKKYRWEFRGLFASLVRDAALGDWVTPHVMRHTFASLAAQAGVSLYKIGSWTGHSSSEVTEIYAHLAAYDPDINRMSAEPVSGTR
jgi:integrase